MGELNAVECIKQGAADYVLKDHLARLPQSLRRAIEEKELRDENRHTHEELTRSNRDLEQFAYVASHDLQEPLRMVATYTQLLAERYQGKLDENADKYIHYAVDGALRMQTLVKDLLAFSRVGRLQQTPQAVDCNLIVQSVMANLQATLQESGARINTPRPPLEASGTSGMKAALNGIPSLSVLDGWWLEGLVEGITGWSIGGEHRTQEVSKSLDSACLHDKLEGTILPLFYQDRDRFIEVMRHTIAINGSHFNSQRMLQQYVSSAYLR